MCITDAQKLDRRALAVLTPGERTLLQELPVKLTATNDAAARSP